MSLDQQTVTEALKQVIDPNTGKDFVAGRSIRNLSVQGGEVRFDVELGYPAKSQHEPIRALLSEAVAKLPGVERVAVHRWLAPASVLAELWGRPLGAVRYAIDSRAWLGRRGFPHRVGWPGLLAVGEWTYPGRLLSDVAEGAARVAGLIAAA